ncbi:hypothetical protein [Natronosalvus vescus]|uniref:hypothetical protein n=1 Tax=Natronosalvus vescus TaxID=2953881 RepID=UPI0020911DD9|nr:hypothetical protein [Natronosalvus vescus]
MVHRPASNADTDVLVCADILGAFGVTPEMLREQAAATTGTARWTDDEESDIESVLSAVLDDSRARTTVLRRTIAQSPRGIDCPARYADDSLVEALDAVFEACGWSATLNRTAGVDGFDLEATDPSGRTRKATASYPSTPLGTDNLPAILESIETSVLVGTDVEFVLLASGTDRWQAVLVESTAIERLRVTYGEHITVDPDEHPLLCPYGLEAYVPDPRGCSQSAIEPPATATAGTTATAAETPWPAWALERTGNRERKQRSTRPTDTPIVDDRQSASVLEESDTTSPIDGRRASSDERQCRPKSETGVQSTLTDDWGTDASNQGSTVDRGRSPLGASDVVRTTGCSSDGNGVDANSENCSRDDYRKPDDVRTDGQTEDDVGDLIGSVQPARVSNDSFGAGTTHTEDERVLAVGAALETSEYVSVSGLLEDDECSSGTTG